MTNNKHSRAVGDGAAGAGMGQFLLLTASAHARIISLAIALKCLDSYRIAL